MTNFERFIPKEDNDRVSHHQHDGVPKTQQPPLVEGDSRKYARPLPQLLDRSPEHLVVPKGQIAIAASILLQSPGTEKAADHATGKEAVEGLPEPCGRGVIVCRHLGTARRGLPKARTGTESGNAHPVTWFAEYNHRGMVYERAWASCIDEKRAITTLVRFTLRPW